MVLIYDWLIKFQCVRLVQAIQSLFKEGSYFCKQLWLENTQIYNILSVCLFVCLSVFISVCMSVCLSVCLSLVLSLCLCVYLYFSLSIFWRAFHGVQLHVEYFEKLRMLVDKKDLAWRQFYFSDALSKSWWHMSNNLKIIKVYFKVHISNCMFFC